MRARATRIEKELFHRACRAYRRRCERAGYAFQWPDQRASKVRDKSTHFGRLELVVYTIELISQGRRLIDFNWYGEGRLQMDTEYPAMQVPDRRLMFAGLRSENCPGCQAEMMKLYQAAEPAS